MSTQPTLYNSYQLVMSLEALLNFGLFFVRVKNILWPLSGTHSCIISSAMISVCPTLILAVGSNVISIIYVLGFTIYNH